MVLMEELRAVDFRHVRAKFDDVRRDDIGADRKLQLGKMDSQLCLSTR